MIGEALQYYRNLASTQTKNDRFGIAIYAVLDGDSFYSEMNEIHFETPRCPRPLDIDCYNTTKTE